MRVKFLGVTIAIGTLILFTSAAYATFDWTGTSINSGYAVTTDWHGMEVPLGEEVTAWAGTTNMDIEYVVFRWLRPDGTSAWNDTDDSGELNWWVDRWVLEFNATREPDEIDDWGVQAIFYDDEGHGMGPYPDVKEKVSIRARSFFAVPEVPIGTIAAVVAMFGALGFFALRRKHVSIKKHP